MKKITLLVLLSLICGLGYAQMTTKDYKVSSFDKIDVSGIYNVSLKKGNNISVKVEAPEELIPYLRVKVEGGELQLGFVEGGIPKALQRKTNNAAIKANVVMPALREVEMSGVTTLRTTDDFSTSEFSLDMSGVSNAEFATLTCTAFNVDLSGVSKVIANVVAEYATVDISGSSNATFEFVEKELTFADVEVSGSCSLNVSGKAIRCDLEVSGAGKFNGEKLEVETMRADISGAASANVRVKSTLQPSVSGAGKLRYTGSCVIKNLDVSGAGKISSY